jgi:hypothetical protein
MNMFKPVTVRELVDTALTALSSAALQATDADSVRDIRHVRSAVSYYRMQMCADDPCAVAALPSGSFIALSRSASGALLRLAVSAQNNPVQLAVLRECRRRLEAMLARRAAQSAAWEERGGLNRSMPVGDRNDAPAIIHFTEEEGRHVRRGLSCA